MKHEYQKLFTNSAIIIKGLTNLLEEKDIKYIIKDRFESARLAGFGEFMNAAEIHVQSSKMEIAQEILENYKMTINSEN
jgi:thiamine monophosphate synthase